MATGLDAGIIMGQEFQEEIRERFREVEADIRDVESRLSATLADDKISRLRGIRAMMAGLLIHAVIAGGLWNGVTSNVAYNGERIAENRAATEANQQLLQELTKSQIQTTGKIELFQRMQQDMDAMTAALRQLRDDVVALRTQRTQNDKGD